MFSIRIRLRNLTRLLNSNRIKSTNHVVHRSYTVRRAMLYVPGNNLKMLKSALNLKVDCIAMDCEDGVAENMKDEARRTIRSLLSEGPVSKSDPEWCVRINCVQTGELCESDIDAVLSAKHLPAAIALPKVEHVDHLQWFAEKVWRKMTERPESDRGPLNLLIFIESAKAVMNMREICQKAEDLSTMAPIVPVALVLGADDLLASLQALKTTDAQALLYSRQKLVLVAKAFGLQAIDMVNIDFKNLNLLQKEAREGALLGFTGKQIIHPSQVTIVQDEFVPSRTVIRRAQRLIEEFNRQQKEGKGAFVFEGVMIDMPSVRQAQNILKIATEAGKPVKELR